MKLVIKIASGLTLLPPSKWHRKPDQEGGREWNEQLEPGKASQNYPREVRVTSEARAVEATGRPKARPSFITPGTHEVERIENPLVPGGEPWLVLKGSRIGAAESYLRRLGVVAIDLATAVGPTGGSVSDRLPNKVEAEAA